MLTPHWKNTADDLRERAARVTGAEAVVNSALGVPAVRVTSRMAAKILSGIVSHVANTYSVGVMQAACAALVRNEPTWQTPAVVRVPLEDGAVPEPIKLIALVAHGLIPLAGPSNVRDALAFWACEDDPGVWTSVVES